MEAKQYILPCIIVIAVLCMTFYYCFEGFQSLPTYNQTDSITKCASYKSCSGCLADKGCGWAPDYADGVKGLPGVSDDTIIACIPQNSGKPFVTSKLASWMLIKDGARTLNRFIKSIGECTDVICATKVKCGDCVTFNMCAWQQITGANSSLTQLCIKKTDAGAADPLKNTITTADKCPVPQCADITNCQTCANTSGCSFCAISGKCLKNSEFGTGVNQCTVENRVSVPASCPCGGIIKCADCTKQVGCAFCKDKNVCVNLDRYGMPPKDTCTQAAIASSESQCTASSIQHLPTSSTEPTLSDLASAQNSGNLSSDYNMPLQTNTVRPDTGKPVSPATEYTMITAPGVARPVGASSIPATVRNEMGYDKSPIETYVKMLVTSQLAAQGIPTNEPFQVNETAALANASDYMRKVFRGVFD